MISVLPPPIGPGYDILIYPGQSNTVGVGQGSWTGPDTSNDSVIFQIGRGDDDMTVIPISDPLDFYTTSIHSFGTSLARYYAGNLLESGRNVLIVPAAYSGTSILEWLGVLTPPAPLYSDMSDRINLGLSQSGGINRIIGWFENQGETDVLYAQNPDAGAHHLMPDAKTYYNYKLQYINQVREDFGIFPMFFGLYSQGWLLGDPVKTSFEAVLNLISSTQPFCKSVSSMNIQDNSSIDSTFNPVHYSAQGHEQLAARFFNEFQSMAF